MGIKCYIIIFMILIYFKPFAYSENFLYIREVPITIYADLRGAGEKEKVIIKQNWIEEKNYQIKSNISIRIYKSDKIVFEYKEIYEPIFYVYVIRFPGAAKSFYRDFIFLVTESGGLRLNIFCWEYQITEGDIGKVAMSKGKSKFRGRYRFIKTDIQVSTPYG